MTHCDKPTHHCVGSNTRQWMSRKFSPVVEHLTRALKTLELGGNRSVEISSEPLNGCFKGSGGPKTLSLFNSYLSYVTSLEIPALTLMGTVRIPKRKDKRTPKPPGLPYLLELLKATVTPGWGQGAHERSIVLFCLSLFQTRDIQGNT